MKHPSDAVLADHALDADAELSTAERRHVDDCAQCHRTVGAMHRILDHIGDPVVMSSPSAEVWPRIRTDLGFDPDHRVDARTSFSADAPARTAEHDSQRSTAQVTPETPAPPPVERRRIVGKRRPVRVGLIAAVLGVMVGVIGAVVINTIAGRPEIVARTSLSAVAGQSGSGSAELIATDETEQLRVEVQAASAGDGFHEVWLLNTDGTRMQSLGTLPPSGHGEYPLPAPLRHDLRGYTIVDVSLEPLDGDSAHSGVSVVRGQLPN